MIDHIGLDVSDILRSRDFYALALAPLGYRVVQEIRSEPERTPTVVMFGVGDEPDFVFSAARSEGIG